MSFEELDDLDFVEYEDYQNLIAILHNKYKTLLQKKVKIAEIRKSIKTKMEWFVAEGFIDFYVIKTLTKKEFIFTINVGDDLLQIEFFTEK